MHSFYVVVIPPASESIAEAVALIMTPLCDPHYFAQDSKPVPQATTSFWVRLSAKRIASYEALLGVSSQSFPRFAQELKAYRGYLDIRQEAGAILALVERENWFDYYQIGGRWDSLVPNNCIAVHDFPMTVDLFGLITPEGEVITHELAESLSDAEARQLPDYEAFEQDPDPSKFFRYVPGIDKAPDLWRDELMSLCNEYADHLGVIVDVHT